MLVLSHVGWSSLFSCRSDPRVQDHRRNGVSGLVVQPPGPDGRHQLLDDPDRTAGVSISRKLHRGVFVNWRVVRGGCWCVCVCVGAAAVGARHRSERVCLLSRHARVNTVRLALTVANEHACCGLITTCYSSFRGGSSLQDEGMTTEAKEVIEIMRQRCVTGVQNQCRYYSCEPTDLTGALIPRRHCAWQSAATHTPLSQQTGPFCALRHQRRNGMARSVLYTRLQTDLGCLHLSCSPLRWKMRAPPRGRRPVESSTAELTSLAAVSRHHPIATPCNPQMSQC